MAILTGNKKTKLYVGNEKVKKVFVGNKMVYSAGNICTYHVDGVTYQEEVDEGASCLTPASFAPQKDGWEFLGWRDTETVGDALVAKVMGDEPVDLYAMFKYPDKTATLSGTTWQDPSWPTDKTVYSNLDFEKYSKFLCTGGEMFLKVNFDAGRMYQLLRGSDGASSIWSAICRGKETVTTKLAGKTLNFGSSKGTGYIYVNYYIEDNSTIYASIYNVTGTLIGRTIVG